jgi:hypothetical protein
MTPGRIACALAVFSALCVLAIFFLPSIDGPYPAVHGPVTALLSIRAAARLRTIIRAGVKAMRSLLGQAYQEPVSLDALASACAGFSMQTLNTGHLAVLRC